MSTLLMVIALKIMEIPLEDSQALDLHNNCTTKRFSKLQSAIQGDLEACA